MNIYVGNLAYSVTEEDLQEAFKAFGEVKTVNIIKDKFSGESKGFGFVEIEDNEKAQSAISGLNGKEVKGRAITVNEARPKEKRGDRPRRSGGGGRPGGGGHYGGGNDRGGHDRY